MAQWYRRECEERGEVICCQLCSWPRRSWCACVYCVSRDCLHCKFECTQLNLGIPSHRHLHLMTFCLDVRYIVLVSVNVTKCDILCCDVLCWLGRFRSVSKGIFNSTFNTVFAQIILVHGASALMITVCCCVFKSGLLSSVVDGFSWRFVGE